MEKVRKLIKFEIVKFKNINSKSPLHNWFHKQFVSREFLSIKVNNNSFKGFFDNHSTRYMMPFVIFEGHIEKISDCFTVLSNSPLNSVKRLIFMSSYITDNFSGKRRLTRKKAIMTLNTVDYLFYLAKSKKEENYISSIREILIPESKIIDKSFLWITE